MSQTRILVTGANGLLGQKLTSTLQRDPSIHVIATAKGKLSYPLDRGEFYALDISAAGQVNQVFQEAHPEIIINTAAMTQVDLCETERELCWKANVEAVQNLIDACQKHTTHFIHVSTDFIFDGSHGPLDESEEPDPVNFYGESKLEAERLLQNSTIEWCILRTVLVYGVTRDMSRSNIVLWVKKSLEEGKPIQVVNDQWRTPTLAEDLAEGCYLAAKKKAKGIYHISGKDFLSPYDIAIQTAEFFDLNKSLISPSDSTKFKQPALRPLKTGFIIDKARKTLGYEPHSFKEGLAIIASQIGKGLR